MQPKLVLDVMGKWEARILNAVAWLMGMRGGSVAYCWLDLDEEDFEVTINDLKRMHEENEMNKQTEKETGE